MSVETSQKVTASQLKRSAFLYVRQSTPRQVLEHTESTARQYALRKRAVALGRARISDRRGPGDKQSLAAGRNYVAPEAGSRPTPAKVRDGEITGQCGK
jgi:hypothetical protein